MKLIAAIISTLLLVTITLGQATDYTRWVNPFIGTGGHGHTFPGATMPFGMVQLSPDTRIDNWDGSSGYHYSDDIIYGFSHTHLSGTGIPDGCDILLMPSNGDYELPAIDRAIPPSYASKFSHSNERAALGFYSVRLDKHNIFAELTATQRVGLHRYTFSTAEKASITLDLGWRDRVLETEYKLVTPTRIEGFRASSSWAKNQKVFFVLELSTAYDKESVTSFEGTMGLPPKALRQAIALRVKPPADGRVLVKVAISYVSIDGAQKNLEAELPGWDFDKVRADARSAWNKELSKIEVSGGTDDQTTNFYTALYHTMIQPNVSDDVDGRYKGHDGKIHQLPGTAALPLDVRRSSASPTSSTKDSGGSAAEQRRSRKSPSTQQRKSGAFPLGEGQSPPNQYTVFSLWDTFRAAHPLYTIIDQKRTADFINTFIRQYEQGGRLPVWELWGEETDTMIGYHAVSVIADAMAKGIKGFDYEKAYTAAKHSAELDHFGLAAYKKRGYISAEDENEGVSKTMEYAYNDYCIATMAQVLMREKLREPQRYREITDRQLDSESDKYFRRSLYYRNLFDAETGFMRPRRNGGFISPFQPNEVTFHFTEGNSWQYSFFVPHDMSALAELHGGKIAFAKKLDELFTTEQKLTGREQPDITGLIGQYAHGNEPSHHIAYLYNYANQPWKTQGYVRRIMNEFYKPTPDGLIGNEDCGQMSAWYILSGLGFYEVNPSRPVYDIGTPLFKEAKIRLENGKIFTIKAANVSAKNTYIKSIKLNGKPHRQTFFHHRDLANGGTLEFEMSDQPVKDWFTEFSHSEVGGTFVAVPLIEGTRVFKDKTTVTLKSPSPNTKITYTIDNHGEEFARKTQTYTGPFTINETSKVEAYGTDSKGRESLKAEATFTERPNDWTVKIVSPYSTQYPGGGDDAIIDGLRGTVNFTSGEWQGYRGKTFEAVIDLQRETNIKGVGGSFFQSAGPWIWMPDRIEFEASSDGTNFNKIAEIKPAFSQSDMKPTMKEFRQAINPTKARYVRVKAFNFGKIPAWHPGAGGDPWIFVDEIFIR